MIALEEQMKKWIIYIIAANFILGSFIPMFTQDKVKVVATLSTFADIAEFIGGDKVEVKYIVAGNQDAHRIKPKPSYALWLSKADLFIETGLDLELWSPALIDKSGNPKIRSGQPGYVAAADGVRMLEVPSLADRSQGDVHIYGNPHIHTSPLNVKIVAENITIGLSKVSPQNAQYFRDRLWQFKQEIDNRLFGEELVKLLTGDVLTQLTESHQLIPFLQQKTYRGKPLMDYLGGWMGKMLPLREQKLVAYHKNWAYFADLFQLEIIGHVEPKPGIPPSPRHVEQLIQKMKRFHVRVIMAANYFDEKKVSEIAERVGAKAVIVPMGVGGAPEVSNYFQLVDYWVQHLRAAFGIEA